MRCAHNLYILQGHFKHIGDCDFFEIVTTSKKIMSVHDHGVVVFRFGRSRSEPSWVIDPCYLLVKRGLCSVAKDEHLSSFCYCVVCFFVSFASRDGHRPISGNALSIFSSRISNERSTTCPHCSIIHPDNVTFLVGRNAFGMFATLFLLIFVGLCLPPFVFVNLRLLILYVNHSDNGERHRKRKGQLILKTFLVVCGSLSVLRYFTFQPVSELLSTLLKNLRTL